MRTYALIAVAALVLLGAHRFGNSDDFAIFLLGVAAFAAISALLLRLVGKRPRERDDVVERGGDD